MAGPFFVDDAGSSTSTYDTWAKAATSINTLDTAITFASGELVYFGADMQCQATNAASLTITGPTDAPPVSFISSTVGSGSTVSYSASTTKQIDTTEGAYDITFDGAFALYGMSLASGRDIIVNQDLSESFYANECRFAVAAARIISFAVARNATELINPVFDLTADGTTNRNVSPLFIAATGVSLNIIGGSFVNLGYRTLQVINLNGLQALINWSGGDFTGLPVGTEILGSDLNSSRITFSNCLMPSTWTPHLASNSTTGEADFFNCGDADSPTYHYGVRQQGVWATTSAIYRSTGATIEGDAVSYLVTTYTRCAEGNPLYLPWMYFTVDSTGSKTFDTYIVNDTADFTDADVWIEVEYFGTADEANTTLTSDHRVITATAANQTDDTSSTWNGSGPSFTYKQKLSCTATVNETGMHRARVAIGVASIASSRYFYVDPKVTVS